MGVEGARQIIGNGKHKKSIIIIINRRRCWLAWRGRRLAQ
jgi:hypothetical protein